MISKELWDEFFSTDSIKRKAELRELIHDAIYKFMTAKFGDKLQYWCFEDADENEVGDIEKYIEDNGVAIEYGVVQTHGARYMTIPYSEFREE